MDAVSYLHLKSGELPPALSLPPFKAVVVADKAVTSEWRGLVVEWLLRSGCLYFIAWGHDCEAWHDAADNVNIAEFEGDVIPDDKFVMTTWHDNKPLSEALWFAAECAHHPVVNLTQTLIVHIADQEQSSELRSAYCAARDE